MNLSHEHERGNKKSLFDFIIWHLTHTLFVHFFILYVQPPSSCYSRAANKQHRKTVRNKINNKTRELWTRENWFKTCEIFLRLLHLILLGGFTCFLFFLHNLLCKSWKIDKVSFQHKNWIFFCAKEKEGKVFRYKLNGKLLISSSIKLISSGNMIRL